MSILNRWLSGALGIWRGQRDEHLRWHLARQPDVAALRQARALAEQALVAQLKKQARQLAHELELGETRHNNELAMLKIQCKQDLKDYQQYLQSLDKLKLSLRENFSHLPEAVAFTIHHHAKQLLNQMWDEQDPGQKLRMEMQLLEFMTAVHEDSIRSLDAAEPVSLPQKTLAFLESGA